MSDFKCPNCGTWWAWPSEHRCPPITSRNSANLISAPALPSGRADTPEPEESPRSSQGHGLGGPVPPAPTGDAAPGLSDLLSCEHEWELSVPESGLTDELRCRRCDAFLLSASAFSERLANAYADGKQHARTIYSGGAA